MCDCCKIINIQLPQLQIIMEEFFDDFAKEMRKTCDSFKLLQVFVLPELLFPKFNGF